MYILSSSYQNIIFRAPPTSWWSSIGAQRVGGALLVSACPSLHLSVRCCGHSNLVIFNRISSKFHIRIASIKLWFKFENVFFRRTIIKMTNKMATPYQFTSIRCCGHSILVIFNQISSKFYIWIASIKLWFKFEYGCFSDER